MKLSQLKELIFDYSESELKYLDLMGLDIKLWNIYRHTLASIESAGSGNYQALGGYENNFDGRYQLGSLAKKDAARILGINYLGDDEISRYLFRNNPQLQENFLIGFTYANHLYLSSINGKYQDLNLNKKLEVLIYAHNQGWKGAFDWLENGSLHVDSFGTEAIIYVEKLNENIDNKDFEVFSNKKNLESNGDYYTLSYIKDFDGNLHGNKGIFSEELRDSYKYQGYLDINNNNTKEFIFTNKESGRLASINVAFGTNEIDYSDHSSGGTTRVVGIYIDPLVTSGEVVQGSDFDSQRRFQNDLLIDNLIVKASGDYDGDGFQEVYWKADIGGAYLRALMHADGNIQYANYQSEEQMSDYLTSNGYDSAISDMI